MFDEEEEVASTPAYASITSLVPDWGVSSRVTAFTTTRQGGVSQAPYDSLNLGLHVNDERSAVVENRRRLEDSFALPSSPCWLNQTHSAKLVKLPLAGDSGSTAMGVDGHQPSAAPSTADGAWTDQQDVVLAVLTADCLPVVIANTEGTRLAVVHAGWRGLAAGILENALAAFDSRTELHAWMGPAIGAQAFEVGEDVRSAFIERNREHSASFVSRTAKGKYWADIYALARTELQARRRVTVAGGDYCTLSQANWFHSHRRDGSRSGRMATVAWISKS